MQPGLAPGLCAPTQTPDSGASITSLQQLPVSAPPQAVAGGKRTKPGPSRHGRAARPKPRGAAAELQSEGSAVLLNATRCAGDGGAEVRQRPTRRGRLSSERASSSGAVVDATKRAHPQAEPSTSIATAFGTANAASPSNASLAPSASAAGITTRCRTGGGEAVQSPRTPTLRHEVLHAMAGAGVSAADVRAAARDERGGGAGRVCAMCARAGLTVPDASSVHGPPRVHAGPCGAPQALAAGLRDVHASLRATSAHAELRVALSGFTPAERRSTASALQRIGVPLLVDGKGASRHVSPGRVLIVVFDGVRWSMHSKLALALRIHTTSFVQSAVPNSVVHLQGQTSHVVPRSAQGGKGGEGARCAGGRRLRGVTGVGGGVHGRQGDSASRAL